MLIRNSTTGLIVSVTSHSCSNSLRTPPTLLTFLQKAHHILPSPSHVKKKNICKPNLKLQNIMLQFALEVEEVGNGQLPLQVRPKEVRCQRRVEASFQGVPRC